MFVCFLTAISNPNAMSSLILCNWLGSIWKTRLIDRFSFMMDSLDLHGLICPFMICKYFLLFWEVNKIATSVLERGLSKKEKKTGSRLCSWSCITSSYVGSRLLVFSCSSRSFFWLKSMFSMIVLILAVIVAWLFSVMLLNERWIKWNLIGKTCDVI